MWAIGLATPADHTPLRSFPKASLEKAHSPPTEKADSAPQPSLLCHACSLPSSASSLSPTLHPCLLFPVPYPVPASCGLSNMMLGSHTRFWVPSKSGIEAQGPFIMVSRKDAAPIRQLLCVRCGLVWSSSKSLLPSPESYYHPSDEKPEVLRETKKGERKDWGCNLVDNLLA